MFRNPFPHKEPYRPSEQELDMLEQYQLDLHQYCPRTKYGFPGIPCPSESIMMQLELKRHKLRTALEIWSRTDRLLQAEVDRVEFARQREIGRVGREAREKRKDSAAFSGTSRPPDRPHNSDLSVVGPLHGSAICDTDDEEVGQEEEEGEEEEYDDDGENDHQSNDNDDVEECYDEDDDQYETESEDYDLSTSSEDRLSISRTRAQNSAHASAEPTPGLVLAMSSGNLGRDTLSKTSMFPHHTVCHDLCDLFATPTGFDWTLPPDVPMSDGYRQLPKDGLLRGSDEGGKAPAGRAGEMDDGTASRIVQRTIEPVAERVV